MKFCLRQVGNAAQRKQLKEISVAHTCFYETVKWLVMVGNAALSVPLFGEGNFTLCTFGLLLQKTGCKKVRICFSRNAEGSVPYLTKTKLYYKILKLLALGDDL